MFSTLFWVIIKRFQLLHCLYDWHFYLECAGPHKMCVRYEKLFNKIHTQMGGTNIVLIIIMYTSILLYSENQICLALWNAFATFLEILLKYVCEKMHVILCLDSKKCMQITNF